MTKYRGEFGRLPKSIWKALAILILLGYSLQQVVAISYYSLPIQSSTSVDQPPVILGSGTAGNSLIYTNNTSAMVTVAAPAPTPTYYPSSRNVVTGTYLSGTVPTSVQAVDSDYFVVGSSGTSTSSTAYNPSSYNLLGSTTLVSGTTADLASDNSVYMTFRSYASATFAQTLYSHQETTTIGGSSYYYQRLSSADASGTTLSVPANTTGRKLMGKFVYQLTGISSIPASTWTVYYRAYKGHNNVVANANVDILVRMSNGTIRSTIATEVATSGALTTSPSTLSGTYSWAAYTVVEQTDYLEIDHYINVTAVKQNYSVYIRIDDNTLALTDQSRVSNIVLPSEFTSEVEFAGVGNAQPWYQLLWAVDSAWNAGSTSVTIQVFNYTLGGYPTSGNGYIGYTSSSTANTDETKNQTVAANPTHFRDGSGNWKIKVKGVKTTATQFDFKADWVKFEPSHYTEYTASTEFLFSSMTTNTPSQLNFTTVGECDTASVQVTIQVWNYSASAYVTNGEGYLMYTSTSSNETKLLSINTNPQFYSSNGNAKLKVTSVKSTSTQHQQKTNQAKLVYSYGSLSNYNYLLGMTENHGANWKVRLRAYDQSSIERLSNCSIYIYDGSNSTQIAILSGAYSLQTGPWYDLAASDTEYIWMHVEASSSGTSYIYAYLEILIPNITTYAQYVITFKIT